MNKIKFTATSVAVILGLICLIPSNAIASNENDGAENSSLTADVQLETRVNNMTSLIDLKYNRKIGNYIRNYVKNYGRSTNKLLGRVNNYFPIFEAELRKRKLPQELKMLPIIESSLRPTVKSRVGAVGLWQFMPATARQYGLTVNGSVDERRDPFRSTEAAVDYLEDLYKRFDDWTLALAAYNCGPGRVSKAMRTSGKKTYWEIQKYLPKETQNYVPKFIAAFYLMNYYYLHDIDPEKPSIDLKTTSLTKIFQSIKFDDISSMTGLPKESIGRMNPAFIRNYIPQSNRGFNLVLPEESMPRFLGYSIKAANPIIESKELYPEGHPLFVSFNDFAEGVNFVSRARAEKMEILVGPKLSSRKVDFSSNAQAGIPSSAYIAEKEKFETYRLGKGESILEVISRRKDLNLKEVLVLNDISLSRPPVPGAVIKLRRI